MYYDWNKRIGFLECSPNIITKTADNIDYGFVNSLIQFFVLFFNFHNLNSMTSFFSTLKVFKYHKNHTAYIVKKSKTAFTILSCSSIEKRNNCDAIKITCPCARKL